MVKHQENGRYYTKTKSNYAAVAFFLKIIPGQGFPGGAAVKNPPANAGDTGSSPGPGGSHMPQSN